MKRSLLHNLVAFILACNYFAFRVELCEEEYEANHRPISDEPALGTLTVNWETFDKDNAPKAFVFNAEVYVALLLKLEPSGIIHFHPVVTLNLIRDKSPPLPTQPKSTQFSNNPELYH